MFLYYLPARSTPFSRDELVAHPVFGPLWWDVLKTDVLFQTRIVQHQIHANGPDGQSGFMLAVMTPAGLSEGVSFGCFKSRQTWHEAAGYWIGHENGSLPDPESLARDFQVSGDEHVLGDGRPWLCPTVKRRARNNLPTSWGIDLATGHFKSTTLPEYVDAWAMCARAWDITCRDGGVPLKDLLDICVQALSINYRVGAAEVTLLGLINHTNYELVFSTVNDREFVLAVIQAAKDKKKAESSPPE